MTLDHVSEGAKHVGDWLSIGVVLGTLAQVLPSVAALFTIVWSAIRIWESRTCQRFLGRPDPGPSDD